MVEEQKAEEQTQKAEAPIIADDLGLIARANEAAERLEKANREMKELLTNQEKFWAESRLQGRSFAGQATVAETETQKWAREAKERYKGTGMDPT